MKWIEDYFNICDKNIENALLCDILVSKKMPPDINHYYFTGIREQLFNALNKQWIELKCIDPIILKREYPDAVIDALNLKGSQSNAVIDKLKNLWKKRELAKTLYESGKLENINDILSKIQAETGQIALKTTSDEYNHAKALSDLLGALERAQLNKSKLAGYSTGIIELDKYTGGIEKGKMYCIGALKKSGKSRFAVFLSLKMREAGAGVLWNSLEMNAMQLNSCALSYYSGVDQSRIGKCMIIPEYQKLSNGFNNLNELNWVISREKTVQSLRARILYERNNKPIDVVIVDFIQRMTDDTKESRTKEVEAISMGLADLSRELNIGMIVLSQLTGVAERLDDDTMPNMSHMKESQGIAENADAIITLHNFERRSNPFNADGSYKLQEIHCLIEQRYDVSGCCFRFLGDLRTCDFVNHTEPYGSKNAEK